MVSVIVPNFNHSRYLHQRIDSILHQTFQDFEVILLDDCSTDNSRELLNRYRSHPKVSHIVINEVNSGSTFAQWRKGLDFAKGDWVWIAESDDYCTTNFLVELVNGCSRSASDLGFAMSVAVDANGVELSDYVYKFEKKYFFEGVQLAKDKLLRANYIVNASSVLIKRDLLKAQLTEEVTDYKLYGDWLVWIKACLTTNVFFSDIAINYHRKHQQTVRSISEANGRQWKELSRFRTDAAAAISKHTSVSTKELLQLNNVFYANELGMAGCSLIRERKLRQALPLIGRASWMLKSLLYVKSAIYWMINRNGK